MDIKLVRQMLSANIQPTEESKLPTDPSQASKPAEDIQKLAENAQDKINLSKRLSDIVGRATLHGDMTKEEVKEVLQRLMSKLDVGSVEAAEIRVGDGIQEGR